jgi:hypothetical protein
MNLQMTDYQLVANYNWILSAIPHMNQIDHRFD